MNLLSLISHELLISPCIANACELCIISNFKNNSWKKIYRHFAKVVLRFILTELKDRCFVYDFTEAKID